MNDRTKKRLELARGLLAADPNLTSAQILTIINAKETKERDSLRSAVDWLEGYVDTEKKHWGGD